MKRFHRYIIFVWIIALFTGALFVSQTAQAASKKASITQSCGYTIEQDALRKVMTKKLGTPYYKMDCSAYANWVVENMDNNKLGENAVKNIKIVEGRSSFDWEKKGAMKITYKPAVYNETKEKWVWGKKKKIALNNCITKWKTYNDKMYNKQAKSLRVGDVLLYADHIALYFGKFDSAKKVVTYLKKNCGMKKITKARTARGLTCYKYKGKTILIDYPECGKYWRIHATNAHGVIIDNDITFHGGTYGGKWRAKVRFVETN